MKADIYYYTRTGNCKRVVDLLTTRIDGDSYQIKDKNKDFSGIIGWFKGGYYAFKEKEVEIDFSNSDRDRLFLVTPVWAGKIPPAVRSFVKQFDFNNKQIFLIATMGGSEGKVFEVLEDLLSDNEVKIKDKVAIKEKEIDKCDRILDKFCSII